jgi:hypothetical protein
LVPTGPHYTILSFCHLVPTERTYRTVRCVQLGSQKDITIKHCALSNMVLTVHL